MTMETTHFCSTDRRQVEVPGAGESQRHCGALCDGAQAVFFSLSEKYWEGLA